MRSRTDLTFENACDALESALAGGARAEIAASFGGERDLGAALNRLRDAMRANTFTAGSRRIALERIANAYDRLTREEGFHVLHDWDGKADHVAADTIPIDVVNFVIARRGDDAADPTVVAIALDYYLFHLLQLLSLRAWDDGDPNDHLDRLQRLLDALQGPDGSGQAFVADAETLILIATSHFELQERGYDRLLARVRSLDRSRQVKVALGHAASMGSHLRFGFEATYARDTIGMRDDNVADYPWLCYALATVMREYARLTDADGGVPDAVTEALLNGLSADARAFVGEAPSSLSRCERERVDFKQAFLAHRDSLLAAFERYRPSEREYSPLSFFFNFSHNVVKGTVVDALLRGAPWTVSFNDLLTSLPRDVDDREPNASKELLANTLMTYARLHPDRIRGQLMPVIVYDPVAGRQAFGTTMRRLKQDG